MLNVIMLNINMLSVIIRSVVTLNVVARSNSFLLLCSAPLVKQRCLSDDFIAINDKRKRLPWVFMCVQEGGKELTNGETERERMCERQSI
jgi:hypothetical protein